MGELELCEDNDIELKYDKKESFKIMQAIYHAVTDKTEKIEKSFNDDYEISYENLVQLKTKLEQSCTQWSVIANNCHIIIRNCDGSKEEFSSIERLKLYDKSNTSPTESIVFTYDILIKLPNLPKPQPYKIVIKFISKLSIYSDMKKSSVPPAIMRLFRNPTINISIEYVDYNVALNLIATLESWVRSIEFRKQNQFIKKIQNNSELLPNISQVVFIILPLIILIKTLPIKITGTSSAITVQYLLVSCLIVFLSYIISKILGNIGERAMDSVTNISYININTGDDKQYREYKKRNIGHIIKVGISLVLLIAQSILIGVGTEMILDKI